MSRRIPVILDDNGVYVTVDRGIVEFVVFNEVCKDETSGQSDPLRIQCLRFLLVM